MSFVEETTPLSRGFNVGWALRPESASAIAARICTFAQRLGNFEPAWADLRPDPGVRRFRAGDPGPVLESPLQDLERRIEVLGRWKPPHYPAPVSGEGYDLLFRNSKMDRQHIWVAIDAGIASDESVRNNAVEVRPDPDHPIWQHPNQGVALLDCMIEAWDAQWACARGLMPGGGAQRRLWLAWMAAPPKPQPRRKPYPYPLPLEKDGPPLEVRSLRGGELKIWF